MRFITGRLFDTFQTRLLNLPDMVTDEPSTLHVATQLSLSVGRDRLALRCTQAVKARGGPFQLRIEAADAPLPEDTLVIGPLALNLFASIDQDDTNWIVILKDVGPDVSVRTARPGEIDIPDDLPERELTRGWLKASHRAVDPARSKPWRPWHPLTRMAQKPVKPDQIDEYQIEILSTGNLFKAGHRICLDITSLDLPSGLAGAHDVEYAPYHICSSKTVVHRIYHDEQHPSHLVLPVIPLGCE